MARRGQRRRTKAKRPATGWGIAGGLAILAVGLAAWALAVRGTISQPSAQPTPHLPVGAVVSRLSTQDFHSLAFSPSDGETVFFGHHGGLLVSRNGGRDWEPTRLVGADAMALAAPPADPQVMYAAGHGVFFRSQDGGQSWQPVSHDLPGTDIHGFAADPSNARHVFAHVVGAGIFSSQDAGEAWTLLSTALPGSVTALAASADGSSLYAAGGQAGLWHSADGGPTWSRVNSLPGGGAVTVAVDPANGRVFAATLGDSAGLYASSHGGANWQPLPLKGIFLALAVSPVDPQRLMVVDEEGRVYASRDGGLSW